VDGPNGVYHYGPAGTFPNQTSHATNYWVDVAFTTTSTIVPTVTSQSPAPGATNVSTATTVKATFNESVIASSISFTLTDGSGTAVPTTFVYDDPSHSVTLTPNAALANSMTCTATVSGATDAAGHTMSSPVTWSFTTAAANSGPFSIFAPTATPANPTDPDTSAVEVGVKFQSDVAGFITGIRFYKGATNTGIHVANLWASDGTLLATATFTAESASGWQQVSFSTPVAISANTTYVASYHTNTGHYAADNNFFLNAGVENAPLHALKDGADGGNGVYNYGPSSAFPNQTYQSSNYWVDVDFTTTVTAAVPEASGAAGSSSLAAVSLSAADRFLASSSLAGSPASAAVPAEQQPMPQAAQDRMAAVPMETALPVLAREEDVLASRITVRVPTVFALPSVNAFPPAEASFTFPFAGN
jgi:hypothetical protein